jgi:hypothetical protein
LLTLDPIFKAALDNGTGKPIIRAILLMGFSEEQSADLLSYKLDGMELTATVANVPYYYQISAIQIERGLLIDGVEYTTKTSWFYVDSATMQNGLIACHAHLFYHKKIRAVNGYQTTATVLTQSLAQTALTAHLPALTPTFPLKNTGVYTWFRGIKFMPTGSLVSINSDSLPNLLAQKYFATMRHADGGKVNVYSSTFLEEYRSYWWYELELPEPEIATVFCSPTAIEGYKIAADFRITTKLIYPFFSFWRDEGGTYHTSGDVTAKGYNLGYLESTVTPKTPPAGSTPTQASGKLAPPPLYLENGDVITWLVPDNFYPGAGALGSSQVVDIIEVFDPNRTPSWYFEFKQSPTTDNTEGGSLPANIANAGNYIPVNTSNF